jgi:uncharacterized OsmC-like protein
MEKNYEVIYTGALRTVATHLISASEIITDAPLDNNGKGEKFSPTDLIAASLASCMLTVIGINFSKRGTELSDVKCDVQKVMASAPRRIAEIHIDFDFLENKLSADDYRLIKQLAEVCPVANSLSSDLKVITNLSGFY